MIMIKKLKFYTLLFCTLFLNNFMNGEKFKVGPLSQTNNLYLQCFQDDQTMEKSWCLYAENKGSLFSFFTNKLNAAETIATIEKSKQKLKIEGIEKIFYIHWLSETEYQNFKFNNRLSMVGEALFNIYGLYFVYKMGQMVQNSSYSLIKAIITGGLILSGMKTLYTDIATKFSKKTAQKNDTVQKYYQMASLGFQGLCAYFIGASILDSKPEIFSSICIGLGLKEGIHEIIRSFAHRVSC